MDISNKLIFFISALKSSNNKTTIELNLKNIDDMPHLVNAAFRIIEIRPILKKDMKIIDVSIYIEPRNITINDFIVLQPGQITQNYWNLVDLYKNLDSGDYELQMIYNSDERTFNIIRSTEDFKNRFAGELSSILIGTTKSNKIVFNIDDGL